MGTCITITSLTVGNNRTNIRRIVFFFTMLITTFLAWFTYIQGLSFTPLHKWTSELQSCFSVLILWSHYKESASLVAPVFIQLITWTWHSAFINLCFRTSHANALNFTTSLTLKTSHCVYYEMSSYRTQSAICTPAITRLELTEVN